MNKDTESQQGNDKPANVAASAVKRLVMLKWDVDWAPRLDDTLNMGHGYEWFGFENLSQGAKGSNGNYRIWPNRSHTGENWSLYRDSDGMFAFEKFASEELCKAAAERWNTDIVA